MPKGMRQLGITNAGWGVCGFTSTFYAMYLLNDQARGQLINATNAFRVLAEIKTYLTILKAEGKQDLIKGIEEFTQTFEGFEDFTVDKYILHVNSAVTKTEEQIKKDDKYGIALPPDVVADYVTRIWGYDAKVKAVKNNKVGVTNCIIGVTSKDPKMKLFDGLEHYMFKRGGYIYSWGERFNSVQEAADHGAGGAKWKVCRLIEIKPK